MEKEKQKKIERSSRVEAHFNNNSDSDNDDTDSVKSDKKPVLNKSSNENKGMMTSKATNGNKNEQMKLSAEEKQEIQTRLMKIILTELLLDVTGIEMKLIANEVYKKASGNFHDLIKFIFSSV